MAEGLTPLFEVAALVLCVAGAAKLRAPSGAARAAALLGLPARPWLVRAFALLELAVGGWCAVAPSVAGAGLMAGLYTLFAGLAVMLARRRAACGCFGEGETPASVIQVLLSGALAAVALAAVFSIPHGIGWIVDRPATELTALVIGTAGAAYTAVLTYTELPRAWAAWSGK